MRDAAVYACVGERVLQHGSQAWKVMVGVDAAVEVRVDSATLRAPVIVVPPYVEQAGGSAGALITFFAEPGSPFAPFAPGTSGVEVPTARVCEALQRIGRQVSLATSPLEGPATEEAFQRLALDGHRGDPRVRRVLRRAAASPELDPGRLAASERLSPVRLRHLVQATTGLSLRTHKLWHRTLLAVELLFAGASIATAAAQAGFADHAHFSRAFKRFFGRTPSSFNAEVRQLAPYAARTPA